MVSHNNGITVEKNPEEYSEERSVAEPREDDLHDLPADVELAYKGFGAAELLGSATFLSGRNRTHCRQAVRQSVVHSQTHKIWEWRVIGGTVPHQEWDPRKSSLSRACTRILASLGACTQCPLDISLLQKLQRPAKIHPWYSPNYYGAHVRQNPFKDERRTQTTEGILDEIVGA